MPRAEFVALCLAETRRTAERYEDLWRRLGLSLDWSLRYSTIDARCQRTAQTSFIKLHRAGYLRRAQDPILWCPEDRTSLAQADVEDLERTSRLHTIRFSDGLRIATTRPELLPACVALYHHPSDVRYSRRERAVVPLFGYEVPVLTDESVDPAYGTGLMMVCTFGDSEDVLKWRRDGLALRLVVEPDGRLGPLAGEFAGLGLTQARSAIIKALDSAGLPVSSEPVRQVVGVHERCQTPVEFQIRERNIVDRWLLSHLADAVAETTAAFEAHDYMQAHQAASRMFWSIYCDRYLEMIKDRLGEASGGLDSDSARWTLGESFRVLLGLFAPFAPFLTEHLYQ